LFDKLEPCPRPYLDGALGVWIDYNVSLLK
jgi:hypothetical protein